jgi:hypothetical protein
MKSNRQISMRQIAIVVVLLACSAWAQSVTTTLIATGPNGPRGLRLVSVLGQGVSFEPRVNYSARSSSASDAVGDFNRRDGAPDLAVANGGAGTVSVAVEVQCKRGLVALANGGVK